MFRSTCSLFALSALIVSTGPVNGEDAAPGLRLHEGRFEVVGLAAADLDRLKKADLSPEAWRELFAVHVIGDQGVGKDQPPVLGTYRIADGVVQFAPRFPPVPGVRYQAVFRPARLPGRNGGEDVRKEFTLAKVKPAEATVLRHVYPSRDKLPENQLKFYLHFSAPMARGEAYRHIRLLDDRGQAVDMPFLELDQELWDPSGTRFTLFIDPGRIKRGVRPREEVGPALVEGKSYALVIDSKWADAQGSPLKETYRKAFHVGAPEEASPDPKSWKIEAPAAGGTAPLKLTFPRPLDHALLQRLLWVTDADGKRVAGSVAVTDEETRWLFTPEQPWRAGKFDLVVDTTLEDLAGNSVGKPFEVDLFRPIGRDLKPETVKRPFEVRAGAPLAPCASLVRRL